MMSESLLLIPRVLRPGNNLLVFIQEQLNKIFTPLLNPMYYLGAINFFLFWILLVTGLYLVFFYRFAPQAAYPSVEYITVGQKYYGGIIRSVHRYAADGMVITILIHIFQVFFSDRFRRARWVAWVSGIVILPWLWLTGVSGYFLVWDQTAQIIALYFTPLLDVFNVTVNPLSRNFMAAEALTITLFFIVIFVHYVLPVWLMILGWIHCMRTSRPVITPPKPVAITLMVSLILLSIAKPAVSNPPADLSRFVGEINIDWFFLFPFTLMHKYSISPGWVWLGVVLIFLLAALMPWLVPEPKKKNPD